MADLKLFIMDADAVIEGKPTNWELNQTRLPLNNEYKHPLIIQVKEYPHTTLTEVVEEQLVYFDKLIGALTQYRNSIRKGLKK